MVKKANKDLKQCTFFIIVLDNCENVVRKANISLIKRFRS